MIRSVSKIKITAVLIAILPILNIYKVGALPLTFGDAALVFIVISLLFHDVKNGFNFSGNGFAAFFVVYFIISLISIVLRGQRDMSDFVLKWLRLIVYYYVIENFPNSLKKEDVTVMQKFSVIVGVIVSSVVFYQSIMANFFGKVETFFLSIFPLNYSIPAEEIQNTYIRMYSYGQYRPISIFCEPAHFAQFALMPLAIALFCRETVLTKKQRIFVSLFITMAILFSYSANGIFIAAILWIIWLIKYIQRRPTIGKILTITIIAAIGVYVFVNMGFMDTAFDRLDTVSSAGSSTGTVRLLQGFAVFSGLPVMAKIFGIGFGNVQAYLIENNITTAYLSEIGNEYMNGFSTVLVSSGVVGLAVYLVIWVGMFAKHKDMVGRSAFIVITILFCSSAVFYSCTTVMYLVFVSCSDSEKVSAHPNTLMKRIVYNQKFELI